MTLPLFPEIVPTEMTTSATLFDNWVAYRAQAKSRVRAERPLSLESTRVYREMWLAFAAFCEAHGLNLFEITPSDLHAFLHSRSIGDGRGRALAIPKGAALSQRYSWRMLHLIDRLDHFHAHREGKTPHGAAQTLLEQEPYRYVNAAKRVPLPDYYNSAQIQTLIAYFTQASPLAMLTATQPWKAWRDRTAVAVMLGAGLTPGDVRVLALHGVILTGGTTPGIPWKLSLPGNGNAPARETPIASWAAQQLADWLVMRAQYVLAGEFVFPSTLTGKPWSHTACHDACKAVLARAGIDDAASGIFKLRHTFALRQLADGHSAADVALWLGFLDVQSMARYERIVTESVNAC